jgi:hypothetical protein
VLAALTGMGLSAAAGLNAYIPFLVVAWSRASPTSSRCPRSTSGSSRNWAIGIGAVLLAEIVLDKIPAVDTVNDTIQTFIRPSMGGLIFAATTAASEVDNSAWMQDNPWVSVVLGVIVSGLVHTGQDGLSPRDQRRHRWESAHPWSRRSRTAPPSALTLIALIAPVLVIIALGLLAWLIIWLWIRVRRWRAQRTPLPVR